MATYSELYELRLYPDLLNRTVIACVVAAEIIRTNEDNGLGWDPANHSNRLNWARNVFADPWTDSVRMYWCLLAANKDVTKANLLAATDEMIQSQVNSHVDLFTV